MNLRNRMKSGQFFVNYRTASEYLTGGSVADNIILQYHGWRGLKSETDEFKDFRRALLSASNLKILELRRGISTESLRPIRIKPFNLSPMESELFSDFLRESRSIKKFNCDYSLLSQAMTESLLLSETIETIYLDDIQIRTSESIVNQGVDETFGRLGKKSHASFIRLKNVLFGCQSSIRGILMARNLTKLNLIDCLLDQTERNILLKLLAVNETLKAFSSDMVFDVKELIQHWNGETDPRPDLNWQRVTIRNCEMFWSIKGFVKERVSSIKGSESRRTLQMIAAMLERSKNPEDISLIRTAKMLLESFSTELFYKSFPHAKDNLN